MPVTQLCGEGRNVTSANSAVDRFVKQALSKALVSATVL